LWSLLWMLGVLELDLASLIGLRRLHSLCCRLLALGGDPDCSFFGVFGLVSAKACVWKSKGGNY
jgi:hypothetical protein